MHIKRVIIEQFKSYKDRVVVDLCPKANVIVGKNGAGKSNVFAAIQFVLSDKFANLRSEERQRLINESAGEQALSASVELIFDNQDKRFPIDKEEISLKRTIGVKKDELFLNHTHSTKADIEGLLESAGLSRSNPYYIVQQGKVNNIIKMSDAKRLDLLKEIAGTRVYDERRKESLKIMEDTNAKREQIAEIIEYIETRLKELDEEKKELKEFNEIDRDRRCIEYTIYDKECQNAISKLEEIERVQKGSKTETDKVHEYAVLLKERIARDQSESKQLAREISDLSLENNKLRAEQRRVVQQHSKLKLQVDESQSNAKSFVSTQKKLKKELETVEVHIENENVKLAAAQKDFEGCLTNEGKVQDELDLKKNRRQALYSKLGRLKQFSSVKERDAFLNKEIQNTQKNIKSDESRQASLTSEIASTQESLEERVQFVDQANSEISSAKEEIQQIDSQYRDLKNVRNTATEKRKELWRRENEVEQQRKNLKDKLKQAEGDLRHTMNRAQWETLNMVKRIAREKNLKGYYGPLCELFKTKEKFRKCVEVVAGNRLFHHVVDTDATAAILIKEIQRQKAGRITVMPLNRISMREPSFPQGDFVMSDVVPLLDQLQFDRKFRPGILQVFGTTLVSRDLEIGSQYARKYNVDAVTLDGDQANRKGALKGGFIEFRRSRLKAVEDIREAQNQLEQLEGELSGHDEAVSSEEQKVNEAIGELSKLEAKKKHVLRQIRSKGQDITSAQREATAFRNQLRQQQNSVQKLEQRIVAARQQVESFKAEKNTKVSDKLSAKETRELEGLNSALQALESELASRSSARQQAELKRNALQNLLNTNLLMRRQELNNEISDMSLEQDNEKLDRMSHEMNILGDRIAENEGKMSDVETSLDAKKKRRSVLGSTLEKLQEQADREVAKLRDASKQLEKLLARKQTLQDNREQYQNKIRELGSLPQDAAKYKRHSIKKLMSMLSKVIAKLRKYENVNKKALDQYINFTQKRNDLVTRKEAQDRGKDAIVELIEHLDRKKDEAINRTFRQIAVHFSQVFKELVPGGQGSIVILSKRVRKHTGKRKRRSGDEEKGSQMDEDEDEDDDDQPDDQSDDDDEDAQGGDGERHYSGIRMKVSFTGKGEAYRMTQLSGGQQTVTALALIFAIQRCDPSPFYLFDEIDANLDSVHRTAISRMIEKLAAAPAQFVSTTFRPELLASGDKFFGVNYQQKVSHVSVVTQQEAHQYIQSADGTSESASQRMSG